MFGSTRPIFLLPNDLSEVRFAPDRQWLKQVFCKLPALNQLRISRHIHQMPSDGVGFPTCFHGYSFAYFLCHCASPSPSLSILSSSAPLAQASPCGPTTSAFRGPGVVGGGDVRHRWCRRCCFVRQG